ncbi:MAG: ABC transporter ATP-binding protein [Fervidobacterium sp.]
MVLEVVGLKKYYKNIKAVDGVSFSIESGEIFALLGPNGAGKTTTLKCILDLRFKDAGEIVKKGIFTYVPEGKELYSNYTVKKIVETTEYLTDGFDKKKCFAVLEQFGIPYAEKVLELSNGQLTQLYLALVLAQKADLYIFDEPTWGLDPIARNQVLEMIRNVSIQGGSVLYTSHILSEVEKVADKVAIMSKGKVVEMGDLDDLKERYCAIKVSPGTYVDGYKYKSTSYEDVYIVTKEFAHKNNFEYEHVTFEFLFEAFVKGSNLNNEQNFMG